MGRSTSEEGLRCNLRGREDPGAKRVGGRETCSPYCLISVKQEAGTSGVSGSWSEDLGGGPGQDVEMAAVCCAAALSQAPGV